MLRRLIPDPFILALLATLALATLLPARGEMTSIISGLATVTVVILFFFVGAKLPREAVLGGIRHWRLHLLILAITFGAFPLLCFGLATLLGGLMPAALWTGILYLAALPSTVQSSIAFTSIARGNVSAAVSSASASQLLGVLLTPTLVGLLAGARGATVPMSNTGEVLIQILIPFVAGHLSRPWIKDWVQRHKATISITDRATILIAVYSAFSAAVVEGIWGRVPLPVLGTLLAICSGILAIALLFTTAISRMFGFAREDEIVIVFCGTKKSLIQGVPMARILFAGPDLGLILLPIMIFHQIQLMACSWIARRYASGDHNV